MKRKLIKFEILVEFLSNKNNIYTDVSPLTVLFVHTFVFKTSFI